MMHRIFRVPVLHCRPRAYRRNVNDHASLFSSAPGCFPRLWSPVYAGLGIIDALTHASRRWLP